MRDFCPAFTSEYCSMHGFVSNQLAERRHCETGYMSTSSASGIGVERSIFSASGLFHHPTPPSRTAVDAYA